MAKGTENLVIVYSSSGNSSITTKGSPNESGSAIIIKKHTYITPKFFIISFFTKFINSEIVTIDANIVRPKIIA